jgi:modification methylase
MHKVYYKDCTDMSEVEDGKVNLIVTSPPYGNLKNYCDKGIGEGDYTYEKYIEDLNSVWEECIRVLAPDGKICINIMPISIIPQIS